MIGGEENSGGNQRHRLQRELELADPSLRGTFSCFYGAGAQPTIIIEAVTALEAFDAIDQRPGVDLGFSGQGCKVSAGRSPTSRKKRARRATPAYGWPGLIGFATSGSFSQSSVRASSR